ncbi:hypothetical protein [Mycolicibacterium palauense]|uniref:hypothetical protein n=1 Tax=Mycolicibacterium palauense TaxID=2034511 RepID=UPI0011455401|nr:hypothetical protein [Mycolicibacterium palauense]
MPTDLVTASSRTAGQRQRRPRARATRYRLDVLAERVDDVIGAVGGWLADRALAGWEVNVAVREPDQAGRDALRILGATLGALDDAGDGNPPQAATAALAVAAELLAADTALRSRVVEAYERELAEVTVWGTGIPVDVRARLGAVQHTLSFAARAFKSRAAGLATAAGACPVTAIEVFHSGARRPVAADLRPLDTAQHTGGAVL